MDSIDAPPKTKKRKIEIMETNVKATVCNEAKQEIGEQKGRTGKK